MAADKYIHRTGVNSDNFVTMMNEAIAEFIKVYGIWPTTVHANSLDVPSRLDGKTLTHENPSYSWTVSSSNEIPLGTMFVL